jgi:hypothetical protein
VTSTLQRRDIEAFDCERGRCSHLVNGSGSRRCRPRIRHAGGRPPPRPASGYAVCRGKGSVLPTALTICAKLVTERANRNSQDACRVSAVAAAMLYCVDDQVALNLRDRLSDKGGKPEFSARLSGPGASSPTLTKVACWLPHLTPSKTVVFAEAQCRQPRWSKLDRFGSEFVTLSRKPVTRVNDRSHSADGLTAWDASEPRAGCARCRGSNPPPAGAPVPPLRHPARVFVALACP